VHHHLDPARIADSIGAWGYPWGYVAIFCCVFVGNLGVPMPEETVLLAAGFLAGREILEFRYVLGVSLLSAVAGDNLGYLIGREGGRRLLERLSRTFTVVHRRYHRLKLFFSSHGNKAVFMARFLAGFRFMAGPMAGAAGMPFWSFFGWNVLGALVWCTSMISIGYLLGDRWEDVARAIHHAGPWVVAVLFLLAIVAYQLWGRERHHPAANPEP
jgi:membrane protein DedA with SNARE-associated domain